MCGWIVRMQRWWTGGLLVFLEIGSVTPSESALQSLLVLCVINKTALALQRVYGMCMHV